MAAMSSPAKLLAAGGPVNGRTAKYKEATCSTTAASLFADVSPASANITRRLSIENKDASIAIYVLLAQSGMSWPGTLESADTAISSATEYIKALYVPAGQQRTISFLADCSVGILAASGTPAYHAVISDTVGG